MAAERPPGGLAVMPDVSCGNGRIVVTVGPSEARPEKLGAIEHTSWIGCEIGIYMGVEPWKIGNTTWSSEKNE